jgi:hypothetical protein
MNIKQMKEILRLGYSESDLLFTYFIVHNSCKKIDIFKDTFIKEHTVNILKWFFSTSGYYDNSISDININCFFSANFVYYMKKLEAIIKTCTVCLLQIHDHYRDYYAFFGEFVEYYESKIFCEIWYNEIEKFYADYDRHYNIYSFMENKKILIINPLSELMKLQFNTGNVYKINSQKIIPPLKDILCYKNTYTFFNNGPGIAITDNYYNICNDISNIKEDYDCAIISCGAYSCLIANFLYTNYNKSVFVIGGELNNIFGIKNQRYKELNPTREYNEYWVEVPEYLKPEGYKNIENGCYW